MRKRNSKAKSSRINKKIRPYCNRIVMLAKTIAKLCCMVMFSKAVFIFPYFRNFSWLVDWFSAEGLQKDVLCGMLSVSKKTT